MIDAALPKTPKPREHRPALAYADVPAAREAVEASGASPVVKGLRRATGMDADVHGFRSSFRTWAAERLRGDKGRRGDGPCTRGRRGCGAELRAKQPVRPAAGADGPMGRVRERPRDRRDAVREARNPRVEEVARLRRLAVDGERPPQRRSGREHNCRRHHPHHLGARHVDVDDQTHRARVGAGPWSWGLAGGSPGVCPRGRAVRAVKDPPRTAVCPRPPALRLVPAARAQGKVRRAWRTCRRAAYGGGEATRATPHWGPEPRWKPG